jgi:hypothetical protein
MNVSNVARIDQQCGRRMRPDVKPRQDRAQAKARIAISCAPADRFVCKSCWLER